MSALNFHDLIFSNNPIVLFGRLAALCGMIFLAGRAGLDLLLTYAAWNEAGAPILRNPNYVSLAFGATVLLLTTWALKSADLYGFGALIIGLSGLIALTALFNRRFRSFVRRPWRELDGLALAYLAGALAFSMMLGVNEHPYLKESALYLLQGFNLFFSRYAAELPHYGITFIAPFFYVAHTISAVFGFLSYGDHFAYYAYGIYALNVLIAPLIPIGAYLVFRRFLNACPAVAVAALFCWGTLSFKVWSLRGESLAWIIGFAFILVLTDVVPALRKEGTAGQAVRLSPLVALLFFSLSLTHVLTTVIISIFSAGYTAAVVAEKRRWSELLLVGRTGVLSLLIIGALYAAFAVSYSGTPSPFERAGQAPPAGDLDAAIQFDNAWAGAPLDVDAPRVLAAPPYVSRRRIAEMTAFLPVASVFRPGIAFIGLVDFPSLAFENVGKLPTFEKVGYAALMAGCIILYLSPFGASANWHHRRLFWGSVAVYLSLIVLGVYLDAKSVSLFPLASIRRSFVYVEFFYWLAIGIAAVDFVLRPAATLLASRAREFPAVKRASGWSRPEWRTSGAWRSALGAIPVVCFVPAWFAYTLAVDVPRSNGNVETVATRLNPLFQAITFVRDHTAVGEWVFSNVSSSDNIFWFLTSGRRSLMEGASIYQLYFLQKEAAHRMHEFATFSATADAEIIAPYGAKYVLLYKGANCRQKQCYGDNVLATKLDAFDARPLFRRVFENESYLIFERVGAS